MAKRKVRAWQGGLVVFVDADELWQLAPIIAAAVAAAEITRPCHPSPFRGARMSVLHPGGMIHRQTRNLFRAN